MPMVKCNLTFGKWVGGEIENGSQKDNNYVVFTRVSYYLAFFPTKKAETSFYR